jgi:phosphonate transport system substrate-binding protein
MKLTRRVAMTATALSALIPAGAAQAQEWKAKYPELVFAVVPAENATGVTERWTPFTAYLTKELGVKVTLRIAQDYAAVIEGQKAGQVHIGSHGPASFARALMAGARIEAFAQDVNLDGSKGYYSVLYVKKDSPYRNLEDLKGKNLGLVDPNSASGYNVPLFTLGKIGIEADKFFAKVVTTGSHENAIIAVQQGTVDAAFNWWNDDVESNLRRMERKGMAKYDDFRIVFKSDMIVNSPMAYNSDLPPALKRGIADAILNIATRDKAAFEKATDGKAQPWAPVDNKAYDVMIELNKFVDQLRRKKAS